MTGPNNRPHAFDPPPTSPAPRPTDTDARLVEAIARLEDLHIQLATVATELAKAVGAIPAPRQHRRTALDLAAATAFALLVFVLLMIGTGQL